MSVLDIPDEKHAEGEKIDWFLHGPQLNLASKQGKFGGLWGVCIYKDEKRWIDFGNLTFARRIYCGFGRTLMTTA